MLAPEELSHETINELLFAAGKVLQGRATLDPEAQSRRLFAYHRLETIRASLHQSDTWLGRLRIIPTLNETGLWNYQIESIIGLQKLFTENKLLKCIRTAREDKPKAKRKKATA